ncbi:hypothetical protein JCM3765_002059 [Sporobolomyces pararoseus]
MEVVLVSRNNTTDHEGNLTTSDYRLEVNLAGKTSDSRQAIDIVPASEWNLGPTNKTSHIHSGVARESLQTDLAYKPHALNGFSNFGTEEPNEFATFIQGREFLKSNQLFREELEDDLRNFAEKSDHTEGFMITSSISNGFSGLTTNFLEESLRQEFSKSTVWVTSMLESSKGWKRIDTDRSKNQRLINQALSLTSLEESSSMVLPIQPSPLTTPIWDNKQQVWSKFLRDDLDQGEVYDLILKQHLQSANSELREPDGLSNIVQQLNWRGNNKFASLSGISPILPASFYTNSDGNGGIASLKKSWKDWSVLPPLNELEKSRRIKKEEEEVPFAQYSVVRGLEFEESQDLGPLLEKSVLPLKEPLSQWVSLPQPYPLNQTSLPIYHSLLPNGRPLTLTQPSIPSNLFGLPDTRFPLPSSYKVQPKSIPILTTLSTKPSTRYLLNYLRRGLKELVRTRDGVLREFEQGEFGLGREGILECLEKLETLEDNYRNGIEEEDDYEVDKDEDENWDDTEDTWDL